MAKHVKPKSKTKKVANGAGAAVVGTVRGTAAVARGTKKAWNYCLPWPLGCGHSEHRQGCKCCAKHV